MTGRTLNCLSLLVAGLFLLPAAGLAQPGDPQRGEALFVGTLAFSAGGAPCLACHGIAGLELGRAAGANYGPDLTALFDDYGEDGVTAILEDPTAFDSMTAIYTERPLSEDEQADLAAFFAAMASRAQPDIGAGLAGHVGLVTLLLLVLIGALGWRRQQGVRRPLVERTRSGKGELA